MTTDKKNQPKTREEAREAGRARPVTMLCFYQPVKFPGMAGASNQIIAGKPEGYALHRNALFVDSIFEYGDDYIVDGKWFIPKSCGALLCRVY